MEGEYQEGLTHKSCKEIHKYMLFEKKNNIKLMLRFRFALASYIFDKIMIHHQR